MTTTLTAQTITALTGFPFIGPIKSVAEREREVEREEAYLYTLVALDILEPKVFDGRLSRNLHNRDGQLLRTLDQVVTAILADELMTGDESEHHRSTEG